MESLWNLCYSQYIDIYSPINRPFRHVFDHIWCSLLVRSSQLNSATQPCCQCGVAVKCLTLRFSTASCTAFSCREHENGRQSSNSPWTFIEIPHIFRLKRDSKDPYSKFTNQFFIIYVVRIYILLIIIYIYLYLYIYVYTVIYIYIIIVYQDNPQ